MANHFGINREQIARAAMRTALENQQAEDSVELFIQHHLEEIEPDYWKSILEPVNPIVYKF